MQFIVIRVVVYDLRPVRPTDGALILPVAASKQEGTLDGMKVVIRMPDNNRFVTDTGRTTFVFAADKQDELHDYANDGLQSEC
jgi:hypothetical protein